MSTVGSVFGTGFRSLLKREILRFVRRPRNTFLPPAITNILYFSVFGVILGGRIREIQGFDYILFILPGLVVLGAVSNAFENSSFSIFHGRWNEYIHEVLTSPLSYTSQVFAYVAAAALRGIVVGFIIVGVGLVFVPFAIDGGSVPVTRPLYLVAFMVIITTLFASFGVMGGLWAHDFDYLTVLNQFILRPLTFFGGVFYSLDILPPLYRTLSLLNPMVYMVNGVRFGFLGYSDVDPNASLVVLTTLTFVVLGVDAYLFKRGYGIIE
ncbi:ABC transporter permease [Halorarius litoreus]|uniref:ABC transporter permease n=1 Tax=Halorarius litoreus TaxID=2962676 RepID=UPI0020CFB3DC|nr:ABC transporter permease [Halorarius litoreus]